MIELNATDERRVWQLISRAVGTEMREAVTVGGASGIEHPVQAVCVDDANKRVVVVLSEANAKTAALMQWDIQCAMPGLNVIAARPLVFDLGNFARTIFKSLENTRFTQSQITSYFDKLNKIFGKEAQCVVFGTSGPSLRACEARIWQCEAAAGVATVRVGASSRACGLGCHGRGSKG